MAKYLYKKKETASGIMRQPRRIYLQQKLNYIHNNPVKEEFVYLPKDYKYSSAID